MSRNVAEKIANNEPLDEDDVQYAVDRGMNLPEEYSGQVSALKTGFDSFGRPHGQVVQGGSFPMPDNSGPGLFLSVEELESLTTDQLRTLAEVKGIEVSGRKASVVEQLAGAESSAEDTDEAEQG